ncbi:MAG: YggS family pyridoxal phosphate-dependent enzyme [Bacteroidota bacterium]
MLDSLANNIKLINQKLSGSSARLVAVTKTQPISVLKLAYQLGLKCFGENKVQEMVEKYEALPKDIEWHMIGHLQTNKVKYIASFVSLIHSVDSFKLLQEINKQGLKNQRVINCLLQVYIASEETKFGLDEPELLELMDSEELKSLQNIKIVGLMGMASNTEKVELIIQEFKRLKSIFDSLNQKLAPENVLLAELSMGMSGDFEYAIDQGSTLVRIGSALFGNRVYL